MPLIVDFMLKPTISVTLEADSPCPPKLCWGAVNAHQVHSYNESIRSELEPVNSAIRNMKTTCVGKCKDDSHINVLSRCCKAFTDAVTVSGDRCFEHTQNRNKHDRFMPGWNESVRIRYQEARKAFLQWRSCGSPKESYVALYMRQTRLSFKYALRRCKRERDIFNVNKLALSLLNQEYSRFWTLVKQQLGGGTPLPPSFEGVTGSVNVANMWADHFKGIFNDVSCDSDIEILNYFASAPSPTIPPNSMEEVCNAVAKLKSGKAAGWDLMSSEHLLHLEPDVLSIIVVILNSILNHATVPDDVIFSLLQPLIKDKNGQTTCQTTEQLLYLLLCQRSPNLFSLIGCNHS